VRRIQKGARVGIYAGEVITTKAFFERYGERAGPYVFSTRSPWIFVDAREPASGLERYVNDGKSRRKNNLRAVDWAYTVAYEATREIEPGEELYISYGSNYWDVKT